MTSPIINQLVIENLGPVLLGICINTYVYGLATYQYGSYFCTKFEDPLWIKSTVISLFCLDTVHSAALVWMAWVYLILGYNDPVSLMRPVWPYPLTIAVTALTAFLTQFFLSYRVYRLTKGKLWYAGIMSAVTSTLGLGFVVTVKAWQVKVTTELFALRPYIAAWLGLEMGLDIIICGVLLYTLSNSRAGFSGSDTVIKRLTRAAVQTGALPGVFAVVTLILFFTKSHTQLYSLTGIPISRLYSTTLMDTILCRGELRDMIQSQRDPTTVQNSFGVTSTLAQNSIQLHIQKEIRVERDDTKLIPSPKCLKKHKERSTSVVNLSGSTDSKTYPPFHAY
ncbi:hypothetical protein FA13DRAFT_1723901 [Coprinellus micaceus]|uniref:DUF6534 domain-containing protein n=1 Tax=Coprinellus micaceus TaxID=71717 RepID=A0A4Y7TZT3_COPMI|nr:hypothetical protein FA13DRAFT_1723901 [Coprinellus micaceus]